MYGIHLQQESVIPWVTGSMTHHHRDSQTPWPLLDLSDCEAVSLSNSLLRKQHLHSLPAHADEPACHCPHPPRPGHPLSTAIPNLSLLPLCLPHWSVVNTCLAGCSGLLRVLPPPNFPSSLQLKLSFWDTNLVLFHYLSNPCQRLPFT